jgi:hypothetical protein
LVELPPFEVWFASAILIIKAKCEEVEDDAISMKTKHRK